MKVFIYVYLQFKSELKENDLALTSLKIPLSKYCHRGARHAFKYWVVFFSKSDLMSKINVGPRFGKDLHVYLGLYIKNRS